MKAALRIGGQMISYHAIFLLISLLFVFPSLGSIQWLQILLSLLLVVGYAWLLFSDGGARGERAATLSVQVDRQREEGRPVDPAQDQLTYKPSTAWKGYLIGVLPFVIIAVLNIVMEPMYPPYQPATPEEIAQIEQMERQAEEEYAASLLADEPQTEADDAATPSEPAETGTEEAQQINPYNVLARLAFMPYQFICTLMQYHAVLLNWVLLLLALVVPLAEPIGYLQGPRLRAKKLKMIQQGKQRKMRNLKVNKKPRQPRKPKMEV